MVRTTAVMSMVVTMVMAVMTMMTMMTMMMTVMMTVVMTMMVAEVVMKNSRWYRSLLRWRWWLIWAWRRRKNDVMMRTVVVMMPMMKDVALSIVSPVGSCLCWNITHFQITCWLDFNRYETRSHGGHSGAVFPQTQFFVLPHLVALKKNCIIFIIHVIKTSPLKMHCAPQTLKPVYGNDQYDFTTFMENTTTDKWRTSDFIIEFVWFMHTQ